MLLCACVMYTMNCGSGRTYTSGYSNQGNRYVGELKNGQRHGQGAMTYANGDKYTGQFKDNKIHGKGTYTWADGEEYTGQWEYGNRHGDGTNTWADGRKYVGQWKDDKKHGYGTMYDWSGKIIEQGNYQNGVYVGK